MGVKCTTKRAWKANHKAVDAIIRKHVGEFRSGADGVGVHFHIWWDAGDQRMRMYSPCNDGTFEFLIEQKVSGARDGFMDFFCLGIDGVADHFKDWCSAEAISNR